MASTTSIHCYDYVNHPFDKVCKALTLHADEVFHQATRSAETRAETVAGGLHVKIAGIEIGKEILIDVKSYVDVESKNDRKLSIGLGWKAAEASRLFPVMEAQLDVYPITGTETQLDFKGEYSPPLGILGKAINSLVGHRIAEASVHHFVSEVAEFLREHVE